MLNALGNLIGTGATTATVDWSTLIDASTFNGLITGVTSALPIIIPVSVTLMSIPFVWNMIRKMIKKH